MTRARKLVLAVAVVGGLLWYAILPPPPLTLAVDPVGTAPVRGAFHVHTRRSDGTGTIDSVAAAAARAGLQFVIITDHGDGTREGEPPSYRSGVLCIDAVEISTEGGHVVALGLPKAPYPLGGETQAVLEDIRRLGAVSIVSHPGSPRAQLRWDGWNDTFDGLEWLNGDSEWRNEGWPDLGRALLTYPFRAVATMATLLDRPEDVLNRWDALTRRRQIVAVAAGDAHARLGSDGRRLFAASVPVPSYEQVFRALSISTPLVRLSGAAGEDARAVLDAIRRGQVYSTVDGLAGPAALAFSGVSGSNQVIAGGALMPDGPVELRVETNAPRGARIVLFKHGSPVASSDVPVLEYAAPPTPGVYRTEVRLAEAPGRPPVPWVVSNPIYVGSEGAPDPSAPARPPATEFVAMHMDGPAPAWRVEKNPRSEGLLDVVPSVGGTQLSLRYGLGGAMSGGLYVAAVMQLERGLAGYDQLSFTGRAALPMRMSVQLRAPDGTRDRRWRRSVYLDEMARKVTVFFDEMRPVDSASGPPVLSEVRDVLFVVDTVNTRPGTSGQLWLDDVRYAR